jgi:glycogen operon protein
VNFSVYSANATAVELLLFDSHAAPEPSEVIRLDPADNRSFNFWHVYVEGLEPGALYGFRVDGPRTEEDLHAAGHRFDPGKLLIDPYARGNANTLWDRGKATQPGDNVASAMRSVVIDPADYDWEGDEPLHRPMHETIVYEMHVRGFTKAESSGVENPGTFLGVLEKIPYLQELGVTAVELMPVFDFDEHEVLRQGPDGPLVNYWGYDSYSFFAPQSWYCVSPHEGAHLDEFRDMVKGLHRAGIEVILDVVYNHTNEGNENGPTITYKGLDNGAYYLLAPWDRQYYLNFTGTGNTLNANHPIVEKMILDSLRFWVREMHVDGFRFDLASILARGPDGKRMEFPPVLWAIEMDDELAETKIIAEPWDPGGLYEVGHFTGAKACEWNGLYRDDVRAWMKGDSSTIKPIATRIAGSSDLYEHAGQGPTNSINFVTAHDGFTLNDLVSYDVKHNDANGERNRDGSDDNRSWNSGEEGDTDDPEVLATRARQVRNFATVLLVSRGVPMFLSGDEVRKSQSGNNNAYCQDNEISWFDWDLVERNADTLRFFRLMIDFRKRHPELSKDAFYTGRPNDRFVPDIEWHGTELNEPRWDEPDAHAFGLTIGGETEEREDIHVMLNTHWDSHSFAIPSRDGRAWFRAVDTSLASPDDIAEAGAETKLDDDRYEVGPRSVVVLVAKPGTGAAPKARRGGRSTRKATTTTTEDR